MRETDGAMTFRMSAAGAVAAAGGTLLSAGGGTPAHRRVVELRTGVAEDRHTRTAGR